STFQISVSPKPPGISEAKYNVLPSWLKLGLPTLYSVLLNGRALMSVHLPSLLTALYNHKVHFFTSKALSFSYSLSLWLSPVKNIVLPSLLIATVPSCHFVFTSFTAVGSEKVPSLKTALYISELVSPVQRSFLPPPRLLTKYTMFSLSNTAPKSEAPAFPNLVCSTSNNLVLDCKVGT